MIPKMTPEEALFLFNNMEFAEKYQGKDEYAEVTIVIKLALEKQIPKKPVFYETGYICPCGSYVKVRKRYCGTCGQALDWSDKE